MKIYFLYLLLLVMVLSACVQQPTKSEAKALSPLKQTHAPLKQTLGPEPDTNQWWLVAFKIPRDGSAAPFYMDTLIAYEIQPILRQFEQRLQLWRFHRRSGFNDGVGHRFSFLFLTRKDIALDIANAVKENPVISQLLEQGAIQRIYSPGVSRGDLVKSTSDRNWPEGIQQTWPYFIRGVSDSWLRLVDFHVQALNVDEKTDWTPQQRIEFFKNVQAQVSQQWKQFGQHAYFHHLSAVFAYERILMRF